MPYRYLIVTKETSFVNHWYEYENHYVYGMTVYDFYEMKYTSNGKDWEPIEEDHL